MNIIDITSKYFESFIGKNDLSSYEESNPNFFRHYFSYWTAREYFTKRFDFKYIEQRKNLILAELPEIIKKVKDIDLGVDDLTFLFFVGNGSTNGHAFKDGNDWVVWIPVESYSTILQVRVFLTHEIIHAIHYKNNEGFYFQNKVEKFSFSRQLITEGIATYGAKITMDFVDDDALWADYLGSDLISGWFSECEKRYVDLLRYAVELYNMSDEKNSFFHANDQKDIYSYRGGYFVGLKIIECIANNMKLDLYNLIRLPKLEIEELFLVELKKEIARTQSPMVI